MENNFLYTLGALMVAIGLICVALVTLFWGSPFQDFVSGLFGCLGFGMIIVGTIAIIKKRGKS
jgi:FtsH-binding integral membrane protein